MIRKGRRHKRGDPGSWVAAKGGNEGTPKPLETNEEPSISELREMLIDIQITVNNILLENKRICNEVSELKAMVIGDNCCQGSFSSSKKQNVQTERELSAARKQLDEKEEESQELSLSPKT